MASNLPIPRRTSSRGLRAALSLILALLLVPTALPAQSTSVTSAQKKAAGEFLDAVASGDPQAVAYAIHPKDLEDLRLRILEMLRNEAQRGESTIRSRLFGAGMPLSEIERLTSINFYAQLARRLTLTGRYYEDAKWLAAIPDRDDTVHVVLRGIQPKERGKVQVVNIVTLRPYGKDWKATLPSEIEAQIDDLINGRRSPTMMIAQAAVAAPAPSAQPGSAAPVEIPAGITELLDAAEKSLAEGNCEQYYREHMSPNFRKVTSKNALETLIATCKNSLGTRELLLSTVRIARELQPRFQYEGQRAVYDMSGQGLPFNRFVLEQVDKRWYIAE
ncbi:MAG: hypothetical protein DIU56_003950 [Pseudomonadota bacterium]|jgi:hypothetical protein|nr:MAG: hypothetical protein DIU56_08555 [Pseudomonadota bacterium]